MNETAISTIDYQQLYDSARIAFLASPVWERKCTDFLRELHQKVTIGDNEKLKLFLRSKRDDVFNTFTKSWIYPIWNKCYDARKNDFDQISFIKKLSLVSNGEIEKDDLDSFFIYIFTTQNIDKLLQQVLQNESQRYSLAINAQNIVIHNGEVMIKWGNYSNDNNENPPEPLKNIMFSDKLFDSDYLLNKLRNTIASFINLGEDNGKLSPAETNQINPGAQNEWYYLLIAISEAEIVARAKSKDVSFIEQMISWFSWLFPFESVDEMVKFKRKFAKSISMERSLWRYGAKKEVTVIKDMWARQRSLGIDYTKVARMQPVARDLKHKLSQLKSDIQRVKQK